MSLCKNNNTKTQSYPLSWDQNEFACKTMRWGLHEEIMVWVNTFLFQSYVHVTMKDNEMSTLEMPLLIIQYIMHKKMVVRKPEKNLLWLQEKTKVGYFREQSLLSSKMQPISLILVVSIYTVLWHICVMNYKTALQQTTTFCGSCISLIHTTSTGPFNI